MSKGDPAVKRGPTFRLSLSFDPALFLGICKAAQTSHFAYPA